MGIELKGTNLPFQLVAYTLLQFHRNMFHPCFLRYTPELPFWCIRLYSYAFSNCQGFRSRRKGFQFCCHTLRMYKQHFPIKCIQCVSLVILCIGNPLILSFDCSRFIIFSDAYFYFIQFQNDPWLRFIHVFDYFDHLSFTVPSYFPKFKKLIAFEPLKYEIFRRTIKVPIIAIHIRKAGQNIILSIF